MNNRIVGTLISLVMLAFLFFYIIYTGVRYFYSPYQTETAYTYTVAESYRTDAIAVRDEVLLPQPKDELLSYVRADGEVVIPGAVVAHIYQTQQDAVNKAQLERINSEIELLKKAQSSSADILRTDLLNAELNDSVGDVVEAVAERDLDDLDALRDEVHLALGQYRVSTGRDENYQKRINYLKKQASELAAETNDQYSVVKTDVGGYFCSVADGYEEILRPDFESVSVKEFEKLIDGSKEPRETDSAGKIQKGHDWYYAIVVPKEELYRFEKGVMVELDLGIEGCNSIPASIDGIYPDDETGDAVVFLKTNYINETLISQRIVKMDIRFKSYSGLRISISALRYDGMTEGVYVKNGNLISFKAIERIYTDEEFILCKSAAVIEDENSEKRYEPLNQFDEIIIKGTDLYDGKVI